MIGATLALALFIEDDGTALRNDPCGSGNFLSVSSTKSTFLKMPSYMCAHT